MSITVQTSSDIKQDCLVCAYNRTLLRVYSDNDVYMSIEQNGTNKTITDLQLALVEGYASVDVSPFLQSFFAIPTNASNNTFRHTRFTITLSDGDTETTIQFCAIPFCLPIGKTSVLASATSNYESATNTDDIIYKPSVVGTVFAYWYRNNNGTIVQNITQIETTSTVNNKTKTVIEIPCCDNNVVVKYLNQRLEWEYFVFANNYDKTYEIEKEDRIYSNLANNTNTDNGLVNGVSGNVAYSVDTLLMDDTMTRKCIDMLKSRKVLMLVDSANCHISKSWIDCDVVSSSSIYTKRGFNKMSFTLTTKENCL